ncbi:hypothetical protein TRIATDRAFT_305552 [Trichoderma atroviride IMI 206040]|uniref:MalT-like TPR region domain-containing protein n=1 Tax=Hypocrea atroviridis (strain ATCC 20476 / IMI 206040) TaxID=452589 RepID=G9NLJ0_HYPAI|nr:uncharacterized protein TRIATDRAFT_305552 [Trichoderma atroviride IMI 206040]EHK48752.1 hypothetical protein TRIATDRAFT_305552 [Trichoderma atroviride IMI 206040]
MWIGGPSNHRSLLPLNIEPLSESGPEYFKFSEILLPHAELILQHHFKKDTKDSELARAKLLMASGAYIVWDGDHDEAQVRFERSIEINSSYLGEKHVETMSGIGLLGLGWVIGVLQDDVKALQILKRVVKNSRESLGGDGPRTINRLSDLTTAIALAGEYMESETMQREALARSERVLGRAQNETLNCTAHLANVLGDPGKTEEAVKLRRDVYDAKKAPWQFSPRYAYCRRKFSFDTKRE